MVEVIGIPTGLYIIAYCPKGFNKQKILSIYGQYSAAPITQKGYLMKGQPSLIRDEVTLMKDECIDLQID